MHRYEAQFNGFKSETGFNTIQDYFNFASGEMRQRMTTFIQGGGLKPLVGEWSFRGGQARRQSGDVEHTPKAGGNISSSCMLHMKGYK